MIAAVPQRSATSWTTESARLFFVMMTDTIGGGEMLTLRLGEALNSRLPVVMLSHPGSPLLEAARARSLATAELDLGFKLSRRTAVRSALEFLSARKRLLRWIATSTCQSDWCCFQYKWEELLWAGAPVAPRVLICEHGRIPRDLVRLPPTRRRLRAALLAADELVAWSDPALESISGVSGRTATRVNAGVSSQSVAAALSRRESIRLELLDSFPASRLLAYSGRLAEDKGIRQAIGSLQELPSNVGLVIIGDGPDRDRLERFASSIKVSERVRFLGHLRDPLPHIAAADALLLLSASPTEGRPLTVLDAAAVGTPVVALDSSPALVAMAGEGLAETIASDSPTAVASAVLRVLSVPRRPRSLPDWSETADQVMSILHRPASG